MWVICRDKSPKAAVVTRWAWCGIDDREVRPVSKHTEYILHSKFVKPVFIFTFCYRQQLFYSANLQKTLSCAIAKPTCVCGSTSVSVRFHRFCSFAVISSVHRLALKYILYRQKSSPISVSRPRPSTIMSTFNMD